MTDTLRDDIGKLAALATGPMGHDKLVSLQAALEIADDIFRHEYGGGGVRNSEVGFKVACDLVRLAEETYPEGVPDHLSMAYLRIRTVMKQGYKRRAEAIPNERERWNTLFAWVRAQEKQWHDEKVGTMSPARAGTAMIYEGNFATMRAKMEELGGELGGDLE